MCGCCRCCRLRFEYQIRDTPKRKSIRYTGRGQEVFFFFSLFIFCFANQYNFMLHHHTICQVHCKRVLLSRPIIITLISSNNVIVRHFVQIYTSHGFTAPINLKCVCVCLFFRLENEQWSFGNEWNGNLTVCTIHETVKFLLINLNITGNCLKAGPKCSSKI